MNIEQSILENLKHLSLRQRQEVLDFSEFLKEKSRKINVQQSDISPKEKVEKWRRVIAKLPQKSANLPDEALHRDSIYGDEY